MKRAVCAFLVLLCLFSLTACQEGKVPGPAGEGNIPQVQDNDSGLVLGETGELTYSVSDTLRPPASAGGIEQYCVCGDSFYALCKKGRDARMQKLAECCSLWKSSKDNSFERVESAPDDYFIEALCGDDEKLCLLLFKDEEYGFCIVKNDTAGSIIPVDLGDDGYGDFYIAFYEGKLLVWRLEGFLQLFDIDNGEMISKVKLENPDHMFIQMCQTADSFYAIFFTKRNGYEYVKIEDLLIGSDLSGTKINCNSSDRMINSISCDENILFADATSLSTVSTETGELTRLFVFSDAGIGSSEYPMILPLKTADGSIYIRDDSYSLSKLEPKLVPKKEKLIYVSNSIGGNINIMLNKFNQNNDKYKFEQEIITAENSEKVYTEIMTGKAPDIMDVNCVPQILSNKQVISDLVPHIESDKKIKSDDLYWNILNELKSGENLYALPSYFFISALAVPYTGSSLIANPSFEEFESILENAGIRESGSGIEPGIFFDSALPVIEKDILTGEPGAKIIDREALSEWLELSKKIQEYNIFQLLISDPNSFSWDKEIFGKFTIVGYPGKNISGAYAETRFKEFSCIVKNTKNEDAAWEFLREYLVSDYYPFSLNKKNTEKCIDGFARTAKASRGEINFNEEDAENLKELLGSINIVEKPDASLRNIIREEAEAYFLGQRDLEKTVQLIENRANILISERGLQ